MLIEPGRVYFTARLLEGGYSYYPDATYLDKVGYEELMSGKAIKHKGRNYISVPLPKDDYPFPDDFLYKYEQADQYGDRIRFMLSANVDDLEQKDIHYLSAGMNVSVYMPAVEVEIYKLPGTGDVTTHRVKLGKDHFSSRVPTGSEFLYAYTVPMALARAYVSDAFFFPRNLAQIPGDLSYVLNMVIANESRISRLIDQYYPKSKKG